MRDSKAPALSKAEAVILLRWVLIIATSYLVLFSRPLAQTSAAVGIFVAAYLTSNLLLTIFLPRIRSQRAFDVGVVLVDTVAVSIGLALTDNASSDFFLLYFVVIFLGALSGRLGLVVGAAVLISGLHLYTMARFVGFDHLLRDGYILRIPFLFVVSLFFGYLVEQARSSERGAEEARVRERMRADFLSMVTHDLKNPLGLVQSMAELLLDGDAGPMNQQQTNLIRRIHANIRRVISLSLNLLDAARIEAGRVNLQRTPVNLADIVDDAMSLARSAGELKGVNLRFAHEPELPSVDLDFMQMERVISNLLDNAIKYTPVGGMVTVLISCTGDQLILTVRDNGPGIPGAELPGLFDKYRRRAESGRTQGTGLGLFIVRAIVEAHGGTVHAESVVGKGTSMTVCLPLPQEPRVNGAAGKVSSWSRPALAPALAPPPPAAAPSASGT